MSSERDTTRIVRSWLRTEEHESADRVLDAVLDALDATPQRRAAWPAWRTITMNKFMTIGLAAAAVLVALLVGIRLFGSSSGIGGPDSDASPTAEPTAQSLPEGDDAGPIAAGRYSIGDPFPVTLTFDVPEGSASCGVEFEWGVCLPDNGPVVTFSVVENVVADPCGEARLEPAVGPSVDDLVTAISNLEGFEASEPIDVTVDGYPATRFTLVAPVAPRCGLRTWIMPHRTNGVGPREENVIIVVDVEGSRIMLNAAYDPALVTDDGLQAIEDLIASISIEP